MLGFRKGAFWQGWPRGWHGRHGGRAGNAGLCNNVFTQQYNKLANVLMGVYEQFLIFL